MKSTGRKLAHSCSLPANCNLGEGEAAVVYRLQIIEEEEGFTMFQRAFGVFVLSIILAALVGCNTIHGMGRDVERAGEKTQDASDAVKAKM
jgi:predicted small secreted protein